MLTTDDQKTVAATLAIDMIELASKYNLTIKNWIITPWYKDITGCWKTEQHLTGTALDVCLDPLEDKARFTTDCAVAGWQAIECGSHIHVQLPFVEPSVEEKV